MSDHNVRRPNSLRTGERLNPPSSLRLKLKLKPLITSENEALGEQLWLRRHEFDKTISCTFCNESLQLEELDFEWPYGRYSVLFPGVPAYRCTNCERTFFPEDVRSAMATHVEYTVAQQVPPPIQRNLVATAFARCHSDSE